MIQATMIRDRPMNRLLATGDRHAQSQSSSRRFRKKRSGFLVRRFGGCFRDRETAGYGLYRMISALRFFLVLEPVLKSRQDPLIKAYRVLSPCYCGKKT